MRGVLVSLATAALLSGAALTGGGCGSKSYEERLSKTLENKRYQARLKANLMDPLKKGNGKFEELAIYVRPPKNMTWSKEFLLTVVEPVKFDLAESFLDSPKQSRLHVLARVRKPATPKKKATAPVNQGEFIADVLALLNGVSGSSLDIARFKEFDKKGNKFKEQVLKANDKTIRVDLFGGKNDPYQVALLFEYPEAERQALVSKIELCLESFAVGRNARRAYAGTVGEEDGEAGAGGGVTF